MTSTPVVARPTRARLAAGLAVLAAFAIACGDEAENVSPEARPERLPAEGVRARTDRQERALAALAAEAVDTRIYFGDLHVHTTYSVDAFARALPFMQGEGLHPPDDACDFARYCSDLDFFAITDHAEALGADAWRETVEATRRCDARAGGPDGPDLVAYLGWEWTQVGATADGHYGHKNVIFRDLDPERTPPRPISARDELLIGALAQRPPFWQRVQFPLQDWSNRERYFQFDRLQQQILELPLCPEGVDSRELPDDCHEVADDPGVLFEKLAQLGLETLVIPHGTTWGFYTPPGSSLDKQLDPRLHDPDRQRLFEIYSGHGNSEEYRPWRAVEHDAHGRPVCPPPTDEYLPCCWRAGELIRERCASPDSTE